MKSLGKGRPMIHDNQTELDTWRHSVAWTGRGARARWWSMAGAKLVGAEFFFPKPRSYSAKVVYPTRKHDLDKLVRAILDALKGVYYDDDGQVTDLTARKRYGAPHALITVQSLD